MTFLDYLKDVVQAGYSVSLLPKQLGIELKVSYHTDNKRVYNSKLLPDLNIFDEALMIRTLEFCVEQLKNHKDGIKSSI